MIRSILIAMPSEHKLSSAPAPSEIPSVDIERLEMLRDICSETDPALFDEMYSAWRSEAARRLAEARTALQEGKPDALRNAAHALKGTSANIGVVRLAEMCRRLEHDARILPVAMNLLAEMESEFNRVQEILAAAHASV